MKTNTHILLLFALTLLQSCTGYDAQAAAPQVDNHLKGEIDYSFEALELTNQLLSNGEEIVLGKINKDGSIHFNLPEFDIKALYKSANLQHQKLQHFFSINDCKDRDAFEKTPFDDVLAEKHKLIIKKYGMKVAILEAKSKDSASENEYFWLYIDRAKKYEDECTKISNATGEVHAIISANIKFKKGWNFIEESRETVKNDSKGEPLSTQLVKKHFTKISPSSEKVKWSLRQFAKDEEIQRASRLDKFTPISKEQFETWAPGKLLDASITLKEHGKPPKGQKNKNNIHLTYANEAEKREIDLYVVDCAKSPRDMEFVDFSYAMENDGKAEKDIKPYVAQYREETKTTQLLYRVKDRVIVNASGVNMDGEELWAHIQALNVEELLK